MLIRIAREVVRDRCLVAGNLSLTWMDEPGSPCVADRVRKTFYEHPSVQGGEKPISGYENYDHDKLEAERNRNADAGHSGAHPLPLFAAPIQHFVRAVPVRVPEAHQPGVRLETRLGVHWDAIRR